MRTSAAAAKRGPDGAGWGVVVTYALLAAATQMLWLTYAAITTGAAKRYGVSVGAIGWLAEIFPLLYVVLAIPAGALLDRWFRPSLAIGGVLVAAGGLVRLGGLTFAWALAGQTADRARAARRDECDRQARGRISAGALARGRDRGGLRGRLPAGCSSRCCSGR